MIALILAFAVAALPSPQGSPPHPPTTGSHGNMQPPREAVDLDYESKARALRAEMRALQESHGGELSAQHRVYLHQKLEALLTAYRREVREVDPMSVNADGSKQH